MRTKFTSLVALACAAGLALPAMAQTAEEILAEEDVEFEAPDLMVGDRAPDLNITSWVKGDEVSSFRQGQTYVVEFWATWCGPCIRGFPHLTEMQEHYGRDVTIIGVNIWDDNRGRDSLDARTERVTEWVGGRDDMGYTVAIDGNKVMEEEWMGAAGRNGIPSAFIVDGDGMVAWIGHPGQMDSALEQVAAGEWDTQEAAASFIAEQKWLPHIYTLWGEGEWDHSYRVLNALLETELADAPQVLNQVAWTVLTNPRIEQRDIGFAIRAAERACEVTEWENSDIMDTLARGYFMDGQIDEAIELQEKAIEVCDDDEMRESLQATLAEYREARRSDG